MALEISKTRNFCPSVFITKVVSESSKSKIRSRFHWQSCIRTFPDYDLLTVSINDSNDKSVDGYFKGIPRASVQDYF